jgi:DNA modification methylase
MTGFDDKQINDLLFEEKQGLTDDDDVPDTPEPITKLGDIWQLGKHRLLCGDSTKEEDVNKLMDGAKADMVFTDPPYGMNLETDYSGMSNELAGSGVKKSNKWDKIIGDDKQFDIREFDWIDCKEQFWCGADYYVDTLPNYGKNGAWFIWDKRTDENMDKMWGSNFETIWSLNKHKREVIRIKWSGIFGREKDDTKKTVHPTQKPTMLSSFFIDKYSKKNNIILDIFGGSGSTLIGCEKTDRICYMMELDQKYCDIIVKRWEQWTGEKATK